MGEKKTKIVKSIKINADKCNGCRACEMACSSFHATPKYSSNNPARSRVRVLRRPLEDIYVPVYAGENAPAECMGRNTYVLDGKEYEECAFCRSACPSRDTFKEPDSGLPLMCDMCESVPALDEPICVTWCMVGALEYEEREIEVEDEPDMTSGEMEAGIDELVSRYGLEKVRQLIEQKTKKS